MRVGGSSHIKVAEKKPKEVIIVFVSNMRMSGLKAEEMFLA